MPRTESNTRYSWQNSDAPGLVSEVLKLINVGFLAYSGEVAEDVYRRLQCTFPSLARWFRRDRDYLCLGCPRCCNLHDPVGFQLPLPLDAPVRRDREAHGLSPHELVRVKMWLRVDEAAWCLNVSRRKIYKMAEEGVLVKHQDQPVRVTSESVREEMERVDM